MYGLYMNKVIIIFFMFLFVTSSFGFIQGFLGEEEPVEPVAQQISDEGVVEVPREVTREVTRSVEVVVIETKIFEVVVTATDPPPTDTP